MSIKPLKEGTRVTDDAVKIDVENALRELVAETQKKHPNITVNTSVTVMGVGGGADIKVLHDDGSVVVTEEDTDEDGVKERCLFFKSNEGVCQSSSYTDGAGGYHRKLNFEYHAVMIGGMLLGGGGGGGDHGSGWFREREFKHVCIHLGAFLVKQ